MKISAKLVLVSLTLASGAPIWSAEQSTAPAAPAQPGRHAAQAGHPRLRAMLQRRAMIRAHAAQRLGLTEEQKTQLKAVRQQTRGAVQAIRSDASLTPEQKRAKVRETLQGAQGQFRQALTPDQQQQLQKMRQRLRERMRAPL